MRRAPARRPLSELEFLPMATGTVKWFNAQKGYGFIQPESGGADVFVHISAVERAGMDNLREGQRLAYELEQGQRGRVSAVNLRAL
jgi:cold shock protein